MTRASEAIEQFREHVRMEAMLFEGALPTTGGAVAFDAAEPGLGLALRAREADRHAA